MTMRRSYVGSNFLLFLCPVYYVCAFSLLTSRWLCLSAKSVRTYTIATLNEKEILHGLDQYRLLMNRSRGDGCVSNAVEIQMLSGLWCLSRCCRRGLVSFSPM